LRFDASVTEADVNEAIRLLESAKSSIYSVESNDRDMSDPISRIYSLILDAPCHETENGLKEVFIENVRERVKARGFTEAQLSSCIEEFSRLGVWSTYNGNRLIIYN
jgi:DNA replication licensing factor MCM7